MRYIIINILILLICSFSVFGQKKSDSLKDGESYAEQELKLALTDTTQPNGINGERIIIKDSLTAINVVEPILFSIYGKENIIEQRPSKTSFVDNYWVINGTMKEVHPGGTFLIIIDSRNCEIIKIIHGK